MFIRRLRIVAWLVLASVVGAATAQQVYEDLIAAVANDRADEVKRLIARGMDANSVDPNGDPIGRASCRERVLVTV